MFSLRERFGDDWERADGRSRNDLINWKLEFYLPPGFVIVSSDIIRIRLFILTPLYSVTAEERMRSRLGNGPVSNFFKELASDYEDNMFKFELLRHLEVTKVLVQKLRDVQPWEITIFKEPLRSSRTNVQIRAKEIIGSLVDFRRLRESKRISFGAVRVS
jgi:hypothetical protein